MRPTLLLIPVIYLLSSCGSPCASFDCQTSTYNLFVANVDFTEPSPVATNIQVVATSRWQDLTHPRVSHDKNWVAYTTYNNTNTSGCASWDTGFTNTEIRAVRMDSSQTKLIIAAVPGEFNSNSYWYGNAFEFTYLSGPSGSTRVFRVQTDATMNVVAGPTEVTVPGTITPYDPQAISNSQLVYGGAYDSGGGNFVVSIFHQTLNPAGTPTGISLGRDSAGTVLLLGDIGENDPKISPDGLNVAFMRRAPNAGVNGFGWRIFVVAISSPLTETNISASLGNTLLVNDGLPEWVDNTTLVFSNVDSTVTNNTRTIWTMQSNGNNRKQVSLPAGYRYSDVYPFLDSSGNQKIIVSAEKIGATCSP